MLLAPQLRAPPYIKSSVALLEQPDLVSNKVRVEDPSLTMAEGKLRSKDGW